MARRDVVLRRMAEVGVLSPAALGAAAGRGARRASRAGAQRLRGTGRDGPVLLRLRPPGARVRAARAGPRATPARRASSGCSSGGLTIRTTLNPPSQAVAEQALLDAIPADDPSGVAATFTAVEPGTGRVQALAVNQAFGDEEGQTKLNLALGGSSGMQGGSTFKPFVLAAAIEQGIPLDLTLEAPGPVRLRRVRQLRRPDLRRAVRREQRRGLQRRPARHGQRDPRLGEHLLPPAARAHRRRPAGRDRREPGAAPVRRRQPHRPAAARRLVRPRLQRGQPAGAVRGVRGVRRLGHLLPAAPGHPDPRRGRAGGRRCRRRPAGRSWPPRSRTR